MRHTALPVARLFSVTAALQLDSVAAPISTRHRGEADADAAHPRRQSSRTALDFLEPLFIASVDQCA